MITDDLSSLPKCSSKQLFAPCKLPSPKSFHRSQRKRKTEIQTRDGKRNLQKKMSAIDCLHKEISRLRSIRTLPYQIGGASSSNFQKIIKLSW